MAAYWGKEQDDWVRVWNTTTSPKEEARAYDKLVGKINFIIANITNRYFTITKDKDEIKEDCRNYVFLKLKSSNLSDEKNIFGYIGYIAKNFIHTKMVKPSMSEKVFKAAVSLDVEVDEDKGDYTFKDMLVNEINDDNYVEEINEILQSKFNNLKYKLTTTDKTQERNYIIIDIVIVEYLIIYINDFNNFDFNGFYEYVMEKTSYSKHIIRTSIIRLFGFDVHYSKPKEISLVDERYKKIIDLLIDDDYTRSQTYTMINQHRLYLKNLNKSC